MILSIAISKNISCKKCVCIVVALKKTIYWSEITMKDQFFLKSKTVIR